MFTKQIINLKLVFLFIYLAYVLLLSLSAFFKPLYNWDMIPYVAVVLSLEQPDKQTIHRMTYEQIKQSIPPQAYANNTASSYQKEMATNYEYFSQQLPFYQIRPLYTSLIYLMYKTGINIVTAIIMISIFSSIFMSIIILRWLLNYLDSFYAYLFSFLIIHSTGILQIAQAFTPDALSAAILILSIYVLTQRQVYFAGLLLVLAIFARTDNIILVALTLSYLRFFALNQYRINWIEYISFMLLSVCSYLSINYFANNYGWATIFHHTLIGLIHNPADYHPTVTWSDYLRVLKQNGFETFLWVNPFLVFLLCAFISISLKAEKIYSHLTILMILSVVIHFLLFPAPFWQRFFIAHYAIISIAMIVSIFSVRIIQRD